MRFYVTLMVPTFFFGTFVARYFSIPDLIAKLVIKVLFLRTTLVLGLVSCVDSQRRISARSYVFPSVHITGSFMISREIGQMKWSGTVEAGASKLAGTGSDIVDGN